MRPEFLAKGESLLEHRPENGREKAVLVGVELPGDETWQSAYSMQELARLADTAGADAVHQFIQKRDRPDPATLLGRGKASEIAALCRNSGAGLVIFDRELTPAQARNLEEITGAKVIDRTQLILDIFARRARTREGRLQVELAQLSYLLPRLTGLGGQLSRLGGGIGTRGPGETKLEMDRRRVRRRIAALKKEIKEVRERRDLLRRNRKEVPFPLVAIVGYTNAGKSTLLKKLTGADVLVEDKLFATLDPVTRRVVLPDNETILLTDTVGFIQNLPHHLVAAFRATLEEVMEADLLLHVVDASHPYMEEQIGAVNEVLASLGAAGKPLVMVYNKADLLPDAKFFREKSSPPAVAVSALKGWGMEDLLAAIARALPGRRIKASFFIPYRKSGLLPVLHEKGRVLREEHGNGGITVEAEIDAVWARRVEAKLKGQE
ncbi:GTPase [Pelotomaculum thermopropionicum SI]|uniref:GTPase HflX n=1 Tax=Pelotomaculum thermopropionicum (strain DSM 13744 / JCM 10971 / SI) TaxID=370438 RepID=A5D0F0_PELTS|nr:GTPase [Pelotomaculum thermopropionicum SI]